MKRKSVLTLRSQEVAKEYYTGAFKRDKISTPKIDKISTNTFCGTVQIQSVKRSSNYSSWTLGWASEVCTHMWGGPGCWTQGQPGIRTLAAGKNFSGCYTKFCEQRKFYVHLSWCTWELFDNHLNWCNHKHRHQKIFNPKTTIKTLFIIWLLSQQHSGAKCTTDGVFLHSRSLEAGFVVIGPKSGFICRKMDPITPEMECGRLTAILSRLQWWWGKWWPFYRTSGSNYTRRTQIRFNFQVKGPYNSRDI